ncbi:MAG: glycosyltransferase [Acidobacteria bacterium]|nr:glycosyltransferase [Acidobacteriota bacterium]
MLELVDVGPRSLDAYRGVAPDAVLDDLRRVATDLRGARVLHVNATPYGGGVSELLRSGLPILNDLGLVAHWRIIRGDDRFFQVTKKIHNGLQGAADDLTEAEREAYLGTSRRNAELFAEDYDFVFLHDPQPAGMLSLRDRGTGRWIWRCHIDTAQPNPAVWAFLRPYLEPFDAAVFTMAEFVPPDFPVARVEIMPPAIDPLSPKNMPLAEDTARGVLQWIGVDLNRPLVSQISRFDPWKDPLGVIEAFRLARDQVPNLQLALVGSMALDDPEGWDVYRQVTEAARAASGVHVFTNLTGVGNIEVNAFQRLSQVAIQKSIREGFGLVVSEALWKGTPVVAGNAGGIPLQMADGVGGVLVESSDECAKALVALLRDPDHARELGRQGRARVREHFLLPRLLLNELELMQELAAGRPVVPAEDRDPVCGMAVSRDARTPEASFEHVVYRFCSNACRDQFLEDPAHYTAHTRVPAREGEVPRNVD